MEPFRQHKNGSKTITSPLSTSETIKLWKSSASATIFFKKYSQLHNLVPFNFFTICANITYSYLLTKKKNALKCQEYSHLLKHFSEWDYEFEFIYHVAMDKQMDQLGLYLRTREYVIHGELNKSKKEMMSGIWAELCIHIEKQRNGPLLPKIYSETKKNLKLSIALQLLLKITIFLSRKVSLKSITSKYEE